MFVDIFFSIAAVCMALFFLAMAYSMTRDAIAKARNQKIANLQREEELESLRTQNGELKNDLLYANKQIVLLMAEKARLSHPEFPATTPITRHNDCPSIEAYTDAVCDERWNKAISGDIVIKEILLQPEGTSSEDLTPEKIHIKEIYAKIYSKQSGKTYSTSLAQCSCERYKYTAKDSSPYVCKHMLTLAIETEALPFLKK